MSIVEATRTVTGGIDTHGEVHVAAALDEVGGLLGSESFGANPDGYKSLLTWFGAFGELTRVGIEGTGSYGAGVARFFARAGVEVVEVDRQNRQARRQSGKSDPLDAVEAARAALSGRARGQAKSRDGSIEAIRVLVVAKRSARTSRIKALTQMRQLTYSAPDQLQSRLKGLPLPQFIATAQGLRPSRSADTVTAATKASLSSLAHRVADLEEEIKELDARITYFSKPPHRNSSPSTAWGSTPPPRCWSLPATIPNVSVPKRPGPTCAASHRSKHPRER
jgi:transposase